MGWVSWTYHCFSIAGGLVGREKTNRSSETETFWENGMISRDKNTIRHGSASADWVKCYRNVNEYQ
jgi:hypothetical protein